MSSFWTDALERKADDGRARQLYDEIFENAPGSDAVEFVELTIKVRVRGGSTAVEDAVRIDSTDKLLAVSRYIRHAMGRFGTISVLTTSGSNAVMHTIRTGEVVDIEAVARVVSLNPEDARRAAGFHPPRIPSPRLPHQGEQQPETD